MSNKQKLEELEATVKNALAEIERLKNGSGFDWDFKLEEFLSLSSGQYATTGGGGNNDYHIDKVNYLKTKQYCIQSARSNAWNSLLFRLAEHFNPDGWEWVVGEEYALIIFNNYIHELADFSYGAHDYMTAKFHPNVIDKVIEELNNNKERWWHIVTDAELVDQ